MCQWLKPPQESFVTSTRGLCLSALWTMRWARDQWEQAQIYRKSLLPTSLQNRSRGKGFQTTLRCSHQLHPWGQSGEGCGRVGGGEVPRSLFPPSSYLLLTPLTDHNQSEIRGQGGSLQQDADNRPPDHRLTKRDGDGRGCTGRNPHKGQRCHI